MDGLILIIILIALNWVLDDVVGMFLLAFLEFGILTNISNFITVGTINLLFYALLLGILCLSSFAKFAHIIHKKGVNHAGK